MKKYTFNAEKMFNSYFGNIVRGKKNVITGINNFEHSESAGFQLFKSPMILLPHIIAVKPNAQEQNNFALENEILLPASFSEERNLFVNTLAGDSISHDSSPRVDLCGLVTNYSQGDASSE